MVNGHLHTSTQTPTLLEHVIFFTKTGVYLEIGNRRILQPLW